FEFDLPEQPRGVTASILRALHQLLEKLAHGLMIFFQKRKGIHPGAIASRARTRTFSRSRRHLRPPVNEKMELFSVCEGGMRRSSAILKITSKENDACCRYAGYA